MSEEDKHEKLVGFPYVIGGLSFIPLIGVPFGIIAIIWGFVTQKRGGKQLALTGAAGIAFTFILYSSLHYFGFVKRGGTFDDLRLIMAESNLTQLVQTIEFYKVQNGRYPVSLKALKESLPANSMVFVHDSTDMEKEPRYFYYELINADHYYLLGVGPDGKPFTGDDILPKVEVGPNSKVGLLFKSVK